MTVADQPANLAAGLCALIVSTLDAVTAGAWPGGDIYTYGSQPGDAMLVPPPTRTTVLVVHGTEQRWFDITVREVDPGGDPADLLFDPEILDALSRRAGRPRPLAP